MHQLPKGILERDQHPALLQRRLCDPRQLVHLHDGFEQNRIDIHVVRPTQNRFVQQVRSGTVANSVRYGHCEQGIGLLANPMRVRDGSILPRPFRYIFKAMPGAEYPERTYSHERSVRLASGVRCACQRRGDRHSAIERTGIHPVNVLFPHALGVIALVFGKRSRKQEGHFRIVCRLPRNRIVGSAAKQNAYSFRKLFFDVVSAAKLDVASQRVPAKLSEHASPCARETVGVVELGLID